MNDVRWICGVHPGISIKTSNNIIEELLFTDNGVLKLHLTGYEISNPTKNIISTIRSLNSQFLLDLFNIK